MNRFISVDLDRLDGIKNNLSTAFAMLAVKLENEGDFDGADKVDTDYISLRKLLDRLEVYCYED